jgi:hypothetical protein
MELQEVRKLLAICVFSKGEHGAHRLAVWKQFRFDKTYYYAWFYFIITIAFLQASRCLFAEVIDGTVDVDGQVVNLHFDIDLFSLEGFDFDVHDYFLDVLGIIADMKFRGSINLVSIILVGS